MLFLSVDQTLTFAACSTIADIALVLDCSSSMNEIQFRQMKTFLKSLVDNINIGSSQSYVAMVTFAASARVEFYLGMLDGRIQVQVS